MWFFEYAGLRRVNARGCPLVPVLGEKAFWCIIMVRLRPSVISDALPFNGGVYLLAAELQKDCRLRVGRLGRHLFPRGFYLYVGSARRNLMQRLRRHTSGNTGGKKLHWHIDYLLAHARIRSIWGFAAPKEWECRLGHRLAGIKGATIPLNGFGSSDCRCKTHLYHFPSMSGTMLESIFPNRFPGFNYRIPLQGCNFT